MLLNFKHPLNFLETSLKLFRLKKILGYGQTDGMNDKLYFLSYSPQLQIKNNKSKYSNLEKVDFNMGRPFRANSIQLSWS